jgi:accessory gene regulator protein AgrB
VGGTNHHLHGWSSSQKDELHIICLYVKRILIAYCVCGLGGLLVQVLAIHKSNSIFGTSITTAMRLGASIAMLV